METRLEQFDCEGVCAACHPPAQYSYLKRCVTTGGYRDMTLLVIRNNWDGTVPGQDIPIIANYHLGFTRNIFMYNLPSILIWASHIRVTFHKKRKNHLYTR
ncbi:hypothetical protein PsorP6_015231 [Peronosclerospora sorghi]|uniref:Uncharacterized protein n=1 Tax=Peronosclerospora sorghi TaxID=230839 RepID=A0ACC0VT88_9STRA|nr:hypothetical protein PsorP6_015231 [Peronosclerospora sorghi]